MNECSECGKKLGRIEGYRHPTMGKDFLLCSSCYDSVSASVERWSNFISPYVGFFDKDSHKSNSRSIGKEIINNIKKISSRFTNQSLNIVH